MEKIFILGHKNIDVDSYISSILLSKLLTFKNIENEIIIPDERIDEETKNILKHGNIYESYPMTYIEDVNLTNKNLALVDHYKTTIDGTVVMCIDHHPTYENIKYLFYDNTPYPSCAYKILNYMLKEGYMLSDDEIKMVIYSIVADTSCLKNSKTTVQSVWWVEDMSIKIGLDLDSIKEVCLCLTDLEQPIDKVIRNGHKTYQFDKFKVQSSYIQVLGTSKYNGDLQCRYIERIKELLIEEKTDIWVFLIYDFENDKTYQVIITKNTSNFEEYNGILSRGKDVMPYVENNILNYIPK